VKLSASWCHIWQCPLEIDSVWAKKDRTGGDGWVHLKGANCMAMSGLGYERPLVGASWPFLIKWPRKQFSYSLQFWHSRLIFLLERVSIAWASWSSTPQQVGVARTNRGVWMTSILNPYLSIGMNGLICRCYAYGDYKACLTALIVSILR